MKQKLTYIHSLYELYEVLGGIVLTLSICFSLNDILSFDAYIIVVILCVCFWLFLFNFIEDNKNKIMTYVVLFGLLLFAFAILQLWKIPMKNLLSNTISYGFGSYLGIHPELHSILFLGFITFWISIISYLIYKIEIIRLYLSGILFLLLILFPILQINLNKITLFFILFYLFINLATICQKYAKNILNKKSQTLKNIKFSIYLMPFCFLMSFIIILLPTKKEPLQWRLVYSFIEAASELTNTIVASTKLHFGANSEYSITFTGYSDQYKIGGDILPSDKIQLLVNGEKATQSVYFIGSIYDYYSGNEWQKTLNDETINVDYKIDVYELLSALYESDASFKDKQDLISINNATIIYKNINTKTVFYPQKSFLVEIDDSYKYKNLGSNILFKKIYWKEILYDTNFIVLDYDNPIMEDIYRSHTDDWNQSSSAKVIQYADKYFGKSHTKFGTLELPEDINSYLSNRTNEINKNYTKIPSTTSKKVKDLAKSLTSDFDNDYDKAKAVEQYLNTFSYTFNPETPPDGEDYLEYFLFTSKSGYCTYFATSMAILLRSVNVPTRYVEGFSLDYQSRESPNVYEIPASNSHAWCEVYLDGIGWIPFEATSRNSASRYQTYETKDWLSNAKTMNQSPNAIPQINTETNQIVVEKEPQNLKPFLFMLCYLIAFVILFFLGYYFLLRNQRLRRYKRLALNQKIMMELLQIIKLIELKNAVMVKNNTVTELFEYLNLYTTISLNDWNKAKDIYMKIRYSTYNSTIQQVDFFQIIRFEIQKEYLKECGILKKIHFKMFQTII